MKVLYVAASLSFKYGGPTRVITELARALTRKGVQVSIFASMGKSEKVCIDIVEKMGVIGLFLFLAFKISIFCLLVNLIKSSFSNEIYFLSIGLMAIWVGLFIYSFIGHPIIRWQTYGVTLG